MAQVIYVAKNLPFAPVDFRSVREIPEPRPLNACPCVRSNPAGKLEGATKCCGRDAYDTAEDLSEMARAGVTNFETDIYEAAGSFADELLGARDALAGYEVKGSHAGGLLEDVGKV